MLGVAVQFDDTPFLDLGDHAAAPDAHLAHTMDEAIAIRVDAPGSARCLRNFCWKHLPNSQCPGRRRTYF